MLEPRESITLAKHKPTSHFAEPFYPISVAVRFYHYRDEEILDARSGYTVHVMMQPRVIE